MPDATGKRWYLVQCKPRQASRALEHLERQGYECLLPMHQIERLHKGQLQKLSEPLFPGYLFIRLDKVEDNWSPIRSTRGVNQIVSFGGRPTPVPDIIISDVTTRTASVKSALSKGDHILIDAPNLKQLDAIFLSRDGESRVLLLLKILQRDVITSLPVTYLKKRAD